MKIRPEHHQKFGDLQDRGRRLALAREFAASSPGATVDERACEVHVPGPDGRTSVVEFSSQGISGIRTAEGRNYAFKRDAQGRVSNLVDPAGQELELDYLEDGRLSQLRRAGQPVLSCDYSEENEDVRLTYVDGTQEHLLYEAGKLVGTVNALGHRNVLEWDAQSRLHTITDPRGFSTDLVRNEEGDIEQILHPDGTVEEFAEASDGSLEMSVNGKPHLKLEMEGERQRNEYADGHFTEILWKGDEPLRGVNPDVTVGWEYNEDDRPVKETQGELEIQYEYDADGNVLSIRASDDSPLRFSYDGDGLVRAIQDWDGKLYHLAYTPQGTACKIKFPNGVVTEAQTTPTGNYRRILTSSPASPDVPVVDVTYQYDPRDRVIESTCQETKSDYYYDAAGQLVDVRRSDGTEESFQYDEAGNRVYSGQDYSEYDQRNRILTSGKESFAHDDHGNLVQRWGVWEETYHYNGQGLLTGVRSKEGWTARFAYDAFGRRIWKKAGNRTTYFLWSGRQLYREWTVEDGREVERKDYLFLPGEHHPLAVRINGQTYFYHTDRLGTPAALTDKHGDVVWEAEYQAYGQIRVRKEKIQQPFRYLGQYHDLETGLYYNVFRYYDPVLGRYITPDPLGYGGGSTNLYLYAGNDPVNRRDPDGLIVPLVAIAIIAGAALIGGLIGGAIEAATAPEGESKLSAFARGFGWGALAGAVGAAVPIIGAAAGLGAVAIGVIAAGADAVIGGIEACSKEGATLGNFLTGAGISLAMTVGTLGLAKIPGVKRALGAVGKRLSSSFDNIAGRLKGSFAKVKDSLKKKSRFKEVFDDNEAWLRNRDSAVKTSKMAPHHAEGFSKVAAARDEVILVRAVNEDAAEHIGKGAATKSMAIKGKSATDDPIKGLIPVDQNKSKLKGDPEKAAEYTELNKKALGEPYKEKNKKPPPKWIDHPGGCSCPPGKCPPTAVVGKTEVNGVEVLADPNTGKPITADYDLLTVGKKSDVETGQPLPYDETKGVRTPSEDETLRDLQNATEADGGQRVVHHGPEVHNPKPEPMKNNLPVTAYEPDGSVRTINSEPELKDFYNEYNSKGYDMPANEGWGWQTDANGNYI